VSLDFKAQSASFHVLEELNAILRPKSSAVKFKNLSEQCSDYHGMTGRAATAIIGTKSTETLMVALH